ncbi:hypothetical protein D3C84_974930 [compost metagenome]
MHQGHLRNFLLETRTNTGEITLKLIEATIGAIEYIATVDNFLIPMLRLGHNLQRQLCPFRYRGHLCLVVNLHSAFF